MSMIALSYNRSLTGSVLYQDLPIKPKYLLTLTVGLKQKDFVNQCVQKVCTSTVSFLCTAEVLVYSGKLIVSKCTCFHEAYSLHMFCSFRRIGR